MFGLGFVEIGVVIVVALLVVGPERLPKMARQLGRILREVRRVASDFQVSLSTADLEEDRQANQRLAANAKSSMTGAIVDVNEPDHDGAELEEGGEQAAGDSEQAAGDSEQAAGDSEQAAGDSEQAAEGDEASAGDGASTGDPAAAAEHKPARPDGDTSATE